MLAHPHKYRALNRDPINRAALAQLKKAGEAPGSQSGLFLLDLALWGLENGVPVPPLDPGQREHLGLLVGQLVSQDPNQFLRWLASNPDGPTEAEQRKSLLSAIESAESPHLAAQRLLEVIQSNLARRMPHLRDPDDDARLEETVEHHVHVGPMGRA